MACVPGRKFGSPSQRVKSWRPRNRVVQNWPSRVRRYRFPGPRVRILVVQGANICGFAVARKTKMTSFGRRRNSRDLSSSLNAGMKRRGSAKTQWVFPEARDVRLPGSRVDHEACSDRRPCCFPRRWPLRCITTWIPLLHRTGSFRCRNRRRADGDPAQLGGLGLGERTPHGADRGARRGVDHCFGHRRIFPQ